MADLDDFFAKKDRKKSKGKKFATADEIAKKLEETGKRHEKIKKEKTLQSLGGQDGDDPGNLQQEDEWRDFEEEKKDYTGLKIQNITLTDDGGDDGGESGYIDEDGGLEENEAGEMVPRKKVSSGPWKVVTHIPNVQDDSLSVSTTDSDKIVDEDRPSIRGSGVSSSSSGSGSYLPPHKRSQSHPTTHSRLVVSGSRNIKSRAAPDVNSEEMFPTLAAGKIAETSGQWNRKKRDETIGFEEVRNSKSHSSRYADTAARMTPGKLSLGNKFGALTHDQS